MNKIISDESKKTISCAEELLNLIEQINNIPDHTAREALMDDMKVHHYDMVKSFIGDISKAVKEKDICPEKGNNYLKEIQETTRKKIVRSSN